MVASPFLAQGLLGPSPSTADRPDPSVDRPARRAPSMEVDEPVNGGAEAMAVDDATVKRKGRGFRAPGAADPAGPAVDSKTATYDRLDDAKDASGNAARSVEGWVVIVKGVHEEATEEDVQDKFSDYGHIMNLVMPLDRRTGYVKGYALVEYETRKEADAAIREASGSELLERPLECDFAFVRGAAAAAGARAKPRRGRSQSPGRKGPLVSRID